MAIKKLFTGMKKAAADTRVHVGCGPHNLMPGWTNVDIREFPGVDRVMDVTREWPFGNLQYVYGEHFIEHLPLEGALAFLVNAGKSLKPGGVLRLTTPNLAWVIKTHYRLDRDYTPEERMSQVCAANRAFHGWGHHFLYDLDSLRTILEQLGYVDVVCCDYGCSQHEALVGIEKHGGFSRFEGEPNTLILEAIRQGDIQLPDELSGYLESNFLKYVRSGH